MQPQVAGFEQIRRRLVGPAQVSAHTRQELVDREWLDDVVVGSAVQAGDFVVRLALGGQQDHRRALIPRTDSVEHRQAALPRQHDVEQDQRVIAVQRLTLAVIALADARDGVAGGREAALDELGDPGLVFDEQNPHATDPTSRTSLFCAH